MTPTPSLSLSYTHILTKVRNLKKNSGRFLIIFNTCTLFQTAQICSPRSVTYNFEYMNISRKIINNCTKIHDYIIYLFSRSTE